MTNHDCDGDPCKTCGGMKIPPDVADSLEAWIQAGCPLILWSVPLVNPMDVVNAPTA